MKTRTTTATDGKKITFTYDGEYYNPYSLFEKERDKNIIFGSHPSFKDMPYCISYTKVVQDKGNKFENRFGVPTTIYYDNGLVGYQCYEYFNDKREAFEQYRARKQCTKYDAQFCDIFFVENDLS